MGIRNENKLVVIVLALGRFGRLRRASSPERTVACY